MNKLFFAFLAALAVTADVSAKNLTIANEFGADARITITYCRGNATTKYLHYNHDETVTLEELTQAIIELAKTKKIRLQKVIIETSTEITTIEFKDNKIKLPATITIKKTGVYNGTEKLDEYKARKVTPKEAIKVAVIAAKKAAVEKEVVEKEVVAEAIV